MIVTSLAYCDARFSFRVSLAGGVAMMAFSADSGVNALYAMHSRWLPGVLGAGDSLFTPGTAIWTSGHLDELARDFSGQPDLTKGRRFLEKLHDQLANVSPEAVQLMAELHAVHFLIISTSAISAAKKRSDLEAILAWMPVPCTVPDDVLEAMAPGRVHPGQWVMTRRDTQLTWLIRFSRAWKDLPGERQHVLAADPWALKAFAETIHTASSDSARLALLHLAHPGTFEPIVSSGHKQLIAERFADVAGNDPDIDRRLLAVRAALTAGYGEGFSWYGDPLVHLWWKDHKAWPAFLGWLERLQAVPDLPGPERERALAAAGKVREARSLMIAQEDGWQEPLRQAAAGWDRPTDGLSSVRWLQDDPTAGADALRALWSADGSPSARLQAFLDRVPPAALGSAGELFDVGAFLLAGDPVQFPPLRIGAVRKAWQLSSWGEEHEGVALPGVYDRAQLFLDELVRDSAGWKVPLRDRLDAHVLMQALVTCATKPGIWPDPMWGEFTGYRGPVPGQEETDAGGGIPEIDLPMLPVDHIADAAGKLHIDRDVLDEIVGLLEDKGQVVLYGPPGTGKTYLAVRLARAITEGGNGRVSVVQFHPATSYEDFFEGLRPTVTLAGQVTYKRTSGPLVAIAEKAAADPGHQYVLVIDEINRANLPKVFGELLYLMEDRTESACTLYRPEEPFQLPVNLWFIGTMNTADRSVALIDAAMRRRFHFVPFFPHDGPMKNLLRRWLGDGGGRAGVADLLDAANQELLSLVGEHLLIGPSHFMKTDLSDRALARIWTYNIYPLIEEQLWGDRDAITRWRWDQVKERFAGALAGTTALAAGPQTGDGGGGGDEPDSA
jgi:5-methylcytosine-specific restriction enzyme B